MKCFLSNYFDLLLSVSSIKSRIQNMIRLVAVCDQSGRWMFVVMCSVVYRSMHAVSVLFKVTHPPMGDMLLEHVHPHTLQSI